MTTEQQVEKISGNQTNKKVSQSLRRGGNFTIALALSAMSLSAASAHKKSYVPAWVQAWPGLQCKLYPTGSAPSSGLTVFTDDDGYLRFHAVRPAADDAVQRLSLDCTDADGKPSFYSVDLASAGTFAPRPVNLGRERGTDRPALQGDPLSYTQAELLQANYGLRPDPEKDADAYSRWLTAALVPGRLLESKRPDSTSHTVTTAQAPAWVGSVLTGAPNYLSTSAVFNVPTGIPGGDETTNTQISIWNGLGGFGTGSGLIQGGVRVKTTPTTASYGSWREYCCGDGISNSYTTNLTPNPGDQIYSQEWYCDAAGNLNLNGGYGCTFLQDMTTGAVLSCTSATGSPCPSVPALPQCSVSPGTPNCMTLGRSAEFVIENESPQLSSPSTAFTDFVPTVTMSGSAYSSATGGYTQTVSSDSAVTLLTDFTNTTSHMNVSLGNSNQTYFTVSQWAPVGGAAAFSWDIPCFGHWCYPEAIAVGPNVNGSTIGDPWVLGTTQTASGDFLVYQWQNSQFVAQPGAGTQIAVSPQGFPWVITRVGKIYYWNGSSFQLAPGNGCATWIGVGPNANGSQYGTPWIIGCDGGYNKNGSIWQLQGSTWVRQPGAATQIAVSPQGFPWVITAAGNIYFWTGSSWAQLSNGCATSIAVGPSTAPFASRWGDVWVTGCGLPSDQGFPIYQLQSPGGLLQFTSPEGTWVQIPGAASQISVSPDLGVPWVVNFHGQIFK